MRTLFFLGGTIFSGCCRWEDEGRKEDEDPLFFWEGLFSVDVADRRMREGRRMRTLFFFKRTPSEPPTREEVPMRKEGPLSFRRILHVSFEEG